MPIEFSRHYTTEFVMQMPDGNWVRVPDGEVCFEKSEEEIKDSKELSDFLECFVVEKETK